MENTDNLTLPEQQEYNPYIETRTLEEIHQDNSYSDWFAIGVGNYDSYERLSKIYNQSQMEYLTNMSEKGGSIYRGLLLNHVQGYHIDPFYNYDPTWTQEFLTLGDKS